MLSISEITELNLVVNSSCVVVAEVRGSAEQILSLKGRGSTNLMLCKEMDLLLVLLGKGRGMLKTIRV